MNVMCGWIVCGRTYVHGNHCLGRWPRPVIESNMYVLSMSVVRLFDTQIAANIPTGVCALIPAFARKLFKEVHAIEFQNYDINQFP